MHKNKIVHWQSFASWLTVHLDPSGQKFPNLARKLNLLESEYSFEIKNGLLYKKWKSENGETVSWQIVIPDILKDVILKHLHDSATGGGHLGVRNV